MGSYFLFCIGNRAKPDIVVQIQCPIVPIVRPRTAVRTIVPIAAEYDAPALILQSRRAYRVIVVVLCRKLPKTAVIHI